jgi:protein FRA10AC1
MSQYKTGKIGLRWRTEKEVISGKGQFICGNKHCDEKDGLASYEVNFCYSEAGENKQALVKLVTCERCADKLHYKRRKEKEQSEKREQEENRRKRNRSRSSDERDNDYEGSKERRKDWSEMEDREGSHIWESSYVVTNTAMKKMVWLAMR